MLRGVSEGVFVMMVDMWSVGICNDGGYIEGHE